MAPKQKVSAARLPFLDWTRGLAALVMLQGHVFHSFSSKDARGESPYLISQFIGGEAPAVFLFLTGVTLAFLMASRERQGLAPVARWLAAVRRGGYLLGIAFLFRIQLWIFGLPAPWTDLFKVDILNCMGITIVLVSVMALFPLADRARLCAVLGLGIALASPIISQIDWNGVPWIVQHYFAPSHDYFSFFPWAAFLVFGASAGSVIRLAGTERLDRVMQWTALVALGLIFAGEYFASFPYSLLPKSDFWLDSPNLVFIKLGVLLLILSIAYLWTHGTADKFSWVRQVGTTSLLIYWVHIELVYGRWLWFWKENLTALECGLAASVLIMMMLGLSVTRTRWRQWRLPRLTFSYPFVMPRRAAGD